MDIIQITNITINITPFTKFFEANFDRVTFNFIGSIKDFKGKVIFTSCHLENCNGLPDWISMIAKASWIQLKTPLVISNENSIGTIMKNENTFSFSNSQDKNFTVTPNTPT